MIGNKKEEGCKLTDQSIDYNHLKLFKTIVSDKRGLDKEVTSKEVTIDVTKHYGGYSLSIWDKKNLIKMIEIKEEVAQELISVGVPFVEIPF